MFIFIEVHSEEFGFIQIRLGARTSHTIHACSLGLGLGVCSEDSEIWGHFKDGHHGT